MDLAAAHAILITAAPAVTADGRAKDLCALRWFMVKLTGVKHPCRR